MALNSEITHRTLSQDEKKAFLTTPDRLLIEPKTRIFRLTGGALRPGQRVSPWWSPVDSMKLPSGAHLDGFWTSARRAHRLRKPVRDYLRARTAISERFNNPMTHLIVASLKQPTWCLAGKVAGQPEFADEEDVFLIGGGHQLWIPNLMFPEHLQLSSLWPRSQ